MTHAQLARYVADRVGGWRDDAHREAFIAALTVALDDRRHNRCRCNGEAAA